MTRSAAAVAGCIALASALMACARLLRSDPFQQRTAAAIKRAMAAYLRSR